MARDPQSQPTPQQFQTSEVQDSQSASCQKCVKVLRELIAGLQEDDTSSHRAKDKTSNGFFSGSSTVSSPTTEEPAPLTLLKAIAGMDNRDRLKVEMVDDGVKLHVPVETTLPDKLLGWTQWMTPPTTSDGEKSSILNDYLLPLALSVKDDAERNKRLVEPLTVELKCRKCDNVGPEAGARAFLMGPQPLSVIVCHNRVHSERAEVEEILTHELVHLYDVQTLKLDLQQCENLAYSEVRAAKAAECRDSWHPHLQSYCVRQKAICATNNLFPVEGRECIQRVFQYAFADNRPFQPMPRETKQHPQN